jgi:hypothetical protein
MAGNLSIARNVIMGRKPNQNPPASPGAPVFNPDPPAPPTTPPAPKAPKKVYGIGEFPCFRYHKKYGARLFQTPEELETAGKGWKDDPAKVNTEDDCE